MNPCTCPDFAINTLGTCKHIEYTLTRSACSKGRASCCAVASIPPTPRLRYAMDRAATSFATWERVLPLCWHTLCPRRFDENGVIREGWPGTCTPCSRRRPTKVGNCAAPTRLFDFLAQCGMPNTAATIYEEVPGGAAARAAQDAPLSVSVGRSHVCCHRGEGAAGRRDGPRQDRPGPGVRRSLMVREFNADKVLIIYPASLKYQWKQEIEEVRRSFRDGRRRGSPRSPRRLRSRQLLQDRQL